MASSERHIEIGKIGRPHGVRGELRLFVHNPESNTPDHIDALVLQLPNGSRQRYTVTRARRGDRFWRLTLEGVQGRDAAAALTNSLAFVDREALPELEDDEFYYCDLLQARVITPDGKPLGEVQEVFSNGAHDVLVILDPEGETWMLPCVEDFLVEIDLDAHVITAHPVEFA